jgi:hypothetical protein
VARALKNLINRWPEPEMMQMSLNVRRKPAKDVDQPHLLN